MCVNNTMCYATKCNHVPISNPRARWNFSSIKDSIFLASTDRLLAALAESNTDKMNSLGVHGSNLKKEAEGGEVTLGGNSTGDQLQRWKSEGGNPSWPHLGWICSTVKSVRHGFWLRQASYGLDAPNGRHWHQPWSPKRSEQKPASGQIRRRRLAKHVFWLRQTSGEQVVRGGLALNGGHQTDANLGPDWPVTHIDSNSCGTNMLK